MENKVHKILHWSTGYDPQTFVGIAAQQPNGVIEEVVGYLRKGSLVEADPKRTHCQLCGMRLGTTTRTDGSLVWPDQTEHYVIAHHVWSPEHEALAQQVVYGSKIEMPEVDALSDYDGDEQVTLGDADFDVSWLTDDKVVDAQNDEEDSPMIQTTPDRFRQALREAQARFASVAGIRAVSGPPAGNALGIHFVVESPAVAQHIPPRLWGFPTHVLVHSSARPMVEQLAATGLSTISGDNYDRFHRQERAYGALEGPVDQYAGVDFAAQISSAYPRAQPIAHGIVEVARSVGAHPFDLANMMAYENNFTFAPNIQYGGKIGDPFTQTWTTSTGTAVGRATGLIQIMPETARQLGTTTERLWGMSATQQMHYVKAYLDMVRKGQPLDTPHKMAMAIFYRDAINWPSGQRFPPSVIEANRGIYTPQDYISKQLGSRNIALPSSTGDAPAVGPEEPGMLTQFQQWLGSWFEPSPATGAPGVPPAPVAPSRSDFANWTVSDGVTLRLVGTGQSFGPGAVPPGVYELQQFNGSSWVAMGPTQLVPGGSYRAYIEGGRIKWSPT